MTEPVGDRLLRSVVDLMGEVADLDRLAAGVARLVCDAVAADAVFVYVLDDDGRSVTLTGATSPFEEAVGSVCLPLGTGVSGWVASHRRPVVLPEGKADDPRWLRFPQLHGSDFTSMASVPMLRAGAEVVGVVNLHTRAHRDWSPVDLELLTSTAGLVAGAIQVARLLRSLELREREQRTLYGRVVSAAEQERVRLAAELHDGVAQRLAAASFHLSAGRECARDEPDQSMAQLSRVAELLDLATQETRATVRALRPPLLDDLGLEAALFALGRDLPGIDLDLDLDMGDLRLEADQETAVYRIAQEGLRNALLHSGAEEVRLRLRVDPGALVLEIVDDGSGELPEGPVVSHGLRGMSDRARLLGAQLDVRGRPGEGTTVRLVVPLPRD